MSSLLQFNGKIDRRGVQLQFTLRPTTKIDVVLGTPYHTRESVDVFRCHICGLDHDHIYLAYRKPAGVWGHWVVFRYLGEEHVPDLSIPIDVDRVPRGAVRCDAIESAKIWHS